MIIETERLIIRKIKESDFDDFCEFVIDEEMCRMMGRDDITDAETARFTFDWLKDREERGYVLELKENGKVIGNLTVTPVPEYMSGNPELKGRNGRGMSFSLSRHYQRRGLMYEAVSAVIDHLFYEGDVEFINNGYFDFNIPSRELHKKLGFTVLLTDKIEINGEEIIAVETVLWRNENGDKRIHERAH